MLFHFNDGVRTARYCEVSFDDDINKKTEGLMFTLIFKAVDSSGNRGIIRVNSNKEFELAKNAVREVTRED